LKRAAADLHYPAHPRSKGAEAAAPRLHLPSTAAEAAAHLPSKVAEAAAPRLHLPSTVGVAAAHLLLAADCRRAGEAVGNRFEGGGWVGRREGGVREEFKVRG
jgi:hypothetical protein